MAKGDQGKGGKNETKKGNAGKGYGKVGAKRIRKPAKEIILGVTRPAIRRLLRRGGVKRINGLMYDEMRDRLRDYLEAVIGDSVTFAEHDRRKTITLGDVKRGLQTNGRTLYA